MKLLRLWGCGLGLAVAAALVFASPQAFAKEGDGFRPIASTYNLEMQISDFGYRIANLAAFVLPADHSAIAAGYSTDGGTVLIDNAKTPARFGAAVSATSKAGWGSGRLRKLAG